MAFIYIYITIFLLYRRGEFAPLKIRRSWVVLTATVFQFNELSTYCVSLIHTPQFNLNNNNNITRTILRIFASCTVQLRLNQLVWCMRWGRRATSICAACQLHVYAWPSAPLDSSRIPEPLTTPASGSSGAAPNTGVGWDVTWLFCINTSIMGQWVME